MDAVATGLGAILQPCLDKAHGRDRCQLVLYEVQAGIEEEQTSRMVGMQQRGAWTRWEDALEKRSPGLIYGRKILSGSWSKFL